MEPILVRGDFYGQIHHSCEIAGARFTETMYSPAFRIPRHSHEGAFLGLVLEGAYTETYDRKGRECKPSSLVFHPEGEVHSEAHYDVVVRIFNVEPAPHWLDLNSRKRSGLLRHPFEFQRGPVVQLATRLHREFRAQDALTPIAMEGLTLELLASACRMATDVRGHKPSRWLRQVRDLLHDRFAENLSLQEIALTVGVHPAHLARSFRQQYHCSVGDYLRSLRVDHARNQLAVTDTPLIDIALNTGYADQSHFSTAFKSSTGMTPSEFRKLHQKR